MTDFERGSLEKPMGCSFQSRSTDLHCSVKHGTRDTYSLLLPLVMLPAQRQQGFHRLQTQTRTRIPGMSVGLEKEFLELRHYYRNEESWATSLKVRNLSLKMLLKAPILTLDILQVIRMKSC